MTLDTYPPLSTGKDSEQDIRKDTHVDVGKDESDTGAAGRVPGFVIVLANHKGGVTKTTSTANLGACLAEAGRRVLIIDADPQANLSEAFGWTEDIPGERLEDLLDRPDAAARHQPAIALHDEAWSEVAFRDRLRIIPCTDALANVAADLPGSAGDGWEQRLAEVIAPLRAQFDLILIDTPPGLGSLPGMAMLAADGLLIPARPADLDVRGAGKLYDLVETTVPGLRILGVLIAAGDSRWRVTRDAGAQMDAEQMRVLPVQIPRAVRVASAPRYHAPTVVLEPDSMVSHAYRRLATHLLQELGR
jgi:chromosome partitioning protein